jgi:hypothetical protein
MGIQIINYLKHVKKEWKWAFISTCIMGFLIHIYKFTNTLPNHDSLYNYYSDQNAIASGRWFLSIVCGITSYFDLPWIIGIFSVFLLALTTVIIVDLYKVENPFVIGLISGIIVSFPSITETFFFEFTADGYYVAMLLATLAVRLSTFQNRKKKNIIISILLICFSCGIYQSYVSFAMILAICYLIWTLLEFEYETIDYLKWIAQQLVIYISGLGAYYLIWKIGLIIQVVQINNNQGLGEMSLSINTIISAISGTIESILFFLLEWNVFSHGWTLYGILNVIFIVTLLGILLTSVRKTKLYNNKIKTLLLVISIAVIPFVACMYRFVTTGISYRPMMLMSLVNVYILSALLADKYCKEKISNAVGLLLAIIIFNNAIIANISYFYMNKSYEATYATGLEIVERIHMLDADTNEMIVIGNRDAEVSLDNTEHGQRIHMLGQLLESDMLYDQAHLVNFIHNTFDESICSADAGKMQEISKSVAVKEMGIWPASNSVSVIDNVIVIKFSEEDDEQ